jgi:hypothetical protein
MIVAGVSQKLDRAVEFFRGLPLHVCPGSSKDLTDFREAGKN